MVSMVLVLWWVGAIPGNGYGIAGQNYTALLQGSEMSAVFHCTIFNYTLILGVQCFKLIAHSEYTLVVW